MKKGERQRKKQAASKRGPFIASHPFNGVSLDIRRRMIADYAKRQCEKFEETLPQLIQLVSSVDPLHVLALMSSYGLMVTPEQQEKHKRTAWTSEIQQGHVEFLQALCLRSPLDKDNFEFPEPPTIQKFFDLLPELFGAYREMRNELQRPLQPENSVEQDTGIYLVQEFMRAHTAVVRNWGYFGSVTRISRQLFSKIDEEYARVAGMKLSKVVDIFEGLLRRHEGKISEHQERVHSVFAQSTKEAMLEKFFSTFKLNGDIDEYRAQLSSPHITPAQTKWALLPWADRFIAQGLIISNQEIAERYDVDLDAVAILTNRISLAFLDLEDEDPQRFFLDNPVWLRPLIYLKKDYYFCPLPQTLMSFVLPIVDELLVPFDGLQIKLSNAKAIFLEDEVERLIDVAFPHCSKCRNFKWKEGSQQFESDLIVRFDTTVILIEAKSGKVSWPALRGAPRRLIEHINKLIVEPSDQSGRLAQRLEEDVVRLSRDDPPLLNFPLSLDGVTCVIRLSVVLHDFATIQSVPSILEEAGVLNNKYPLAPCISLADLEVMLDLLDSPCIRLHYLRRRAELSTSLKTIGDELDLLGMYLDTAMNLGEIHNENNKIITSGYSGKIDRYYSLKDEGIFSKKPRPNISQWFRRLCNQLEDRARPGWSELACSILSIAPPDQIKFERLIRTVAVKIKNGKLPKNRQDTILLIPPEWSNQALAFQVRRRDGIGGYGTQTPNIATQAFQSSHVQRCVVVVVDAGDINLSYISAALFTREGSDATAFY